MLKFDVIIFHIIPLQHCVGVMDMTILHGIAHMYSVILSLMRKKRKETSIPPQTILIEYSSICVI